MTMNKKIKPSQPQPDWSLGKRFVQHVRGTVTLSLRLIVGEQHSQKRLIMRAREIAYWDPVKGRLKCSRVCKPRPCLKSGGGVKTRHTVLSKRNYLKQG